MKNQVYNFAEENPDLKKTELISKFCEINDTAGKTKINNIVNEMLKDYMLIETKGPKNAKYINAANQEHLLKKEFPDCGF